MTILSTKVPNCPANAAYFAAIAGRWPVQPELVPIIAHPSFPSLLRVPVFELDMLPTPPFDVLEWVWFWKTCTGDLCTSTTEPAAAVCHQPGWCVLHDPPGTVVPL